MYDATTHTVTSLQLGLDLVQALVCPGAGGGSSGGSAGGSVGDLAVGELGHGHGGDVRDDVGSLLGGGAGHGSHRGYVGGVAEGRGAEEAGEDGTRVRRVQRHGRGQRLGEKRRASMYVAFCKFVQFCKLRCMLFEFIAI